MATDPFIIDADADAYLDAVHATNPFASERLEEALDRLEMSPGDPDHRIHELRPDDEPRAVWGIKVVAGLDEFMILWVPVPPAHGATHGIRILFAGPNPFR